MYFYFEQIPVIPVKVSPIYVILILKKKHFYQVSSKIDKLFQVHRNLIDKVVKQVVL